MNNPTSTTVVMDLPCKPSVGDVVQTSYTNETVVSVCFVTPFAIKERPVFKEYDLIIITK